MTEVGFYHLTRWPLERALPKLLEKALQRGHRAVVVAGSQERMEALNTLLWTYEQRSWLPHGGRRDGNAELQPVYLTTREENPNGADILILVDGVRADHPERFARVVDLFDGGDEVAVAQARERWRACAALGLDLTYWQQGERGGWERKG